MSKLNLFNISSKGFSKEARYLLSKKFNYFEFKSKKVFLKNVEKCDILFTRIEFKINHSILEKAKRLKIIATNTTGLDHIDHKILRKKKIKIISLNDSRKELNAISASAEFTWAILLSLVKRIPYAFNQFKQKEVFRDKFLGTQIKNKIIGIIGMGRNGLQIKRYAKAFKLKVFCWDKFKVYRNNCNLNFLLNKSDIVVLCIPLNLENKNFIDKTKLNKLKKNSFFINTSRGELVDEKELLRLLKKKYLLGAALDVLHKKEDKIKNFEQIKDYLKKNNNLIVTPHIAGVTKESWRQSEIIIAKKLIKIL